MNLDELRGNHSGVTEIDTTAGKVPTPEYVPQQKPVDPQFAPSERIRGGNKRTPTIDNLPNPEDKPLKPMKEVQTKGQMLTGMDKFDINTLPKKPAEQSDFERGLMDDLEQAVNDEIESIDNRMNAIADAQYKEHLAMRQEEAEAFDASTNRDIDSMFGDEEGYEPEVEVNFEQPKELNEFSTDDDYEEDINIEYNENPNEDFFEVNEDKEDFNEFDDDYGSDESENIVDDDMIDDNYIEEEPAEEEDETLEFEPEEDIEPEEEDTTSLTVEESEGIDEDEFFNKADSITDDLKKETNEQSAVDEDKMLDELKGAVKANISTIKRKINLKNFSVAKTPVTAAKAISFSVKDVSKADWVLPNAQICISTTGLSGSEIFSLDPSNSNRNKINTFKEIYSIIYRHITNRDKGTFEKWMKTTRYSDISHIYFALYKATFYGSNFIHYECPECHHVFIKDFDFDDLVKYKDDETKKKMQDILNGHITANKKYPVTRYQVSDNYVFDIKEPSIWNTVIEVASLSDAFLEKYEDLINTIIAIDKIYVIDFDNSQLIPVNPNKVDGNIVQTVANKISTYSDVIRNIPSDAFFDLRTKIANAFESNEDIKYVVPACTCPKCKKKINESEREGSDLLFTRHQLGALGVI